MPQRSCSEERRRGREGVVIIHSPSEGECPAWCHGCFRVTFSADLHVIKVSPLTHKPTKSATCLIKLINDDKEIQGWFACKPAKYDEQLYVSSFFKCERLLLTWNRLKVTFCEKLLYWSCKRNSSFPQKHSFVPYIYSSSPVRFHFRNTRETWMCSQRLTYLT